MLPTQLEMFRPWHLTMNCENTPREEERSKAKPSRNSQKNTSAENFCARFQTAAVTRIRPTSSKNAPMRVYRNRTDVLQNYADFVSSNTGGANIAGGRDTCRPIIRAAENLNVGCSTEIIDVNVLSRESTSFIAQNAYVCTAKIFMLFLRIFSLSSISAISRFNDKVSSVFLTGILISI